jgi:alpha-tubulin suppressor-like RCC1 family protein
MSDFKFSKFDTNSTKLETHKNSPIQTISSGNNWCVLSSNMNAYVTGAIKTDGTLWLWGNHYFGSLGNNNTIPQSSPVQTISGGTNWSQVSIGYNVTGAIKTDGTLWLWGRGCQGRLGNNNSIEDQSSPVQTIAGGTNWCQINLGVWNHSAAIKTDGTLWLWGGGGGEGQLGNNNTIPQSSPVQTISGGTNWKQVSAGSYHSSAIKTDGTLWLWGDSRCGNLGTNDDIDQSSPVQTISGGTNWKQVSASSFTSAIKTDGTLWAWGYNRCGQLGNGSYYHASSPVQTVSGGTNWCSVSSGYWHSAALKDDGTFWTWGSNQCGQLGNCFYRDTSSPAQTIAGGNNWCQFNAGLWHSSAIKADGTLWTWGANCFGELGNEEKSIKVTAIATPVKDVRCYTCSCIPIPIGEGQNVWGVPEE